MQKKALYQWWNDIAVWKDFRLPYILENLWVEYIQHVMSEHFTRRSQSGTGTEADKFTIWLPRTPVAPFHSFHSNFFILQAMTLGREPSPMEFFMETHVRGEDRQKEVQQFLDNRSQHFVVCWFSTIFFFKLLFSRI